MHKVTKMQAVCHKSITQLCSLKPYNIKGKTITTNAIESTGVLNSCGFDSLVVRALVVRVQLGS